eukprot:9204353-Ditylum_brightwellii.AAC.2
MSALANLATTPSLIRAMLDGKDLDPKPFIRIQYAAAKLICNIEVCMQNGTLGQIFSRPTTLYVKRKANDNDINPSGKKKQKPEDKKKWPADNEVVGKERLQRKRAGSRKPAKEQ